MSCESYKLLIGSYVDGELHGAAREEIESHLSTCPECVALAEEFRRLDEAAAREEIPHVTGEEWTLLWDRVRTQQAQGGAVSGGLWQSRVTRWGLAAAAALLLFGLGALLGRGLAPATPQPRVTERGAESPATAAQEKAAQEKDAVAERHEAEPPVEKATLPYFSSL